jgi:hypothetical protein
VIKVSFIDSYKQEINPEVVLEIMPELKEDYLQHHPCKWEEVRIQLWSVASSRIEDCALRYYLITKTHRDISRYVTKQWKNK